MKLSELREMMKKDAVIDEDNLSAEAVKTARLYNKYQNLYYGVAEQIIDLKHEFDKKKLFLYEYWMGKCDDEVYKERPKKQKVLKADLDIYMKADDEYCRLETNIQKLELLAKMIDDFMKQISSRNFAIKNAIDYKKFQNGNY